jgi:hypothetical protein
MKIIHHRVTETQRKASFLLFELSERLDALALKLFAESSC